MTIAAQSFDPVWERIFREREWGKYPPEHVIRFVAQNYYGAQCRNDVRLLDLGSGPGANTWFMAREGFTVAAIDGSGTAIAKLKARLGADGLVADARVGDFTKLPWDDFSFDAAVDNAAICCNRFEAAKRVVAEVRRVLKPGGMFCSATFTDRSWGFGEGKEIEPGGFVDIVEGPLAGKGFCLFMGRSQVTELYREYELISVERISWTVNHLTKLIELWVVTCRKPL